MNRIKVKWSASDGYVGKDRPQWLAVRADDFDPSATDAEIADGIREMIEEDFAQKVTASYEDGDIAAAVSAIRAVIGDGDRIAYGIADAE